MAETGDMALGQIEAAGGRVETLVGQYNEATTKIDDSVCNNDLTDKKAMEEKAVLGKTLSDNILATIGEIEAKEAELREYCSARENPVSEEERRENDLRGIAEDGILRALRNKNINEWSTETDRTNVALKFLHDEVRGLRHDIRKGEVRQLLINTKGGVVMEREGNSFNSKKLGAEAYRLHIYEEALSNNDLAVTEVMEDPYFSESLFSGDANIFARYMQVRAEAETARIPDALKQARSEVESLRVRASGVKYLAVQELSKLMDRNKLKYTGDQLKRISGLLRSNKFEATIGGKKLITGHNFNQFAAQGGVIPSKAG